MKSLPTIESQGVTLDMLNNFCFHVWKSDKSWEPGMLLKTWKFWKLEKLENLKTWKFENFENLNTWQFQNIKNDRWDMLNNFCFHV